MHLSVHKQSTFGLKIFKKEEILLEFERMKISLMILQNLDEPICPLLNNPI
jgi:hypothetical protein